MSETSRRVALETLTEVEVKACFADEVLSRRLSRLPPLEKRDKAFVSELVRGTLRWRGRIDHLLGQVLTRPLESVPVRIKNTLRLGAYQILFLDGVPDWAAVAESSELARKYGHEGHVGFVNGVLRNLIRKREGLSFPDPSDTVSYLAVTQSYPEWLVQRWVRRFGKETARELLKACNIPPRLTLRVNTLKISREEFLDRIHDQVPGARPHPLVPEGVEAAGAGGVRELPGYNEGWFYVQDPGSMLVSRLVGAEPGERVLDACAAPGGKTSHLAQLMGDQGTITALEIDEVRIKTLRENMGRLGIRSVQTRRGDAASVEFAAPFDRVLIDAPCSGLGTLRRHPEAKWQKREEDILRHQERQLSILRNIGRFVRQGGTLVYATCSTEPEENEEVIGKFLEGAPEFGIDKMPVRLEKEFFEMFDKQGFLHAYPHMHGTDAFFAVRLTRG